MPEDLFWQPGQPVIDFIMSPAPATAIVPTSVNFLPQDPAGRVTFYQPAPGQQVQVNFDAGPSMATDGEIVRYIWDFGNGNTASGRKVSQSFGVGTFSVVLTVETNTGAQYSTGALCEY
ncbi:MAG: PKD domain-containing protein [Verrucomicrobia bacterium]|nr:PKD domain-containing protein [Verrucomicrobiota bacterium]